MIPLCLTRKLTVDQNIFQRLFHRVSEILSSLFQGKTNHESSSTQLSQDASSGSHDSHGDHSHDHHENHSHGDSLSHHGSNSEQTLSSLDLNFFHKIDTVVGHGNEAFPGADVSVHYTGWLIDTNAPDLKGQKFDSSVDRGQTFNFPLGQGHVIRGWDEGFAGMKIGGKRTLLIPPEMGYGARGAGGVIPPNATLMFEVELFGVD